MGIDVVEKFGSPRDRVRIKPEDEFQIICMLELLHPELKGRGPGKLRIITGAAPV
jgi:hypothetical protein